jgi:hypothetical protein
MRSDLQNTYFRQVLFTGKHAQLVVMARSRGRRVAEVHERRSILPHERGEAKFVFNQMTNIWRAQCGRRRRPRGTYHNVINASRRRPKLYTIWHSPPNHSDGTVHKTKSEAEAVEGAEHHR